MADPANDFIRDYQTLAQQSWEAWTRQLQSVQPSPVHPFTVPPHAPAPGSEALERTLAGLKGYFDWMQAAAASQAGAPTADWRQQLQQLFGAANSPFSQAFGGIDSSSVEGFAAQWQSWMQAARQAGIGSLSGLEGATPVFGLHREQQMQQQTMAVAVLAAMQASSRYQTLIQRANAEGMQRLQDKLAERTEPGRQIDSLKALYDLWVDATEEAYAQIALSEEFRDTYGEMVNTQMRVRQLQQQQTQEICQQLGMPTRAEVSSLGERLQALRRELRASRVDASGQEEIMALRREVVALRRQMAAAESGVPRRTTAAKVVAVAAKKAPAKKARVAGASKSKPRATSAPQSSPRKRK